MFARIAHRYDLMNRLIDCRAGCALAVEVIQRAVLPPGGSLLDLGAGTGDLARRHCARHPKARRLLRISPWR